MQDGSADINHIFRLIT